MPERNNDSKWDFGIKSDKFVSNNFENNLKYALSHEKEQADAWNKAELKTDRKAKQTGNVYVEFQSRNLPSGIDVTEAKYWIFELVDENENMVSSILIETERLKDLIRFGDYREARGGDDYTSIGYLIPVVDLIDFTK